MSSHFSAIMKFLTCETHNKNVKFFLYLPNMRMIISTPSFFGNINSLG